MNRDTRKILLACKKPQKMSDLVATLGDSNVSTRATKSTVAALVKAGLIIRIGETRNSTYVISDLGKTSLTERSGS